SYSRSAFRLAPLCLATSPMSRPFLPMASMVDPVSGGKVKPRAPRPLGLPSWPVSLLTDLDAFSTEHLRCRDLDGGVDEGHIKPFQLTLSAIRCFEGTLCDRGARPDKSRPASALPRRIGHAPEKKHRA